MSGPVEHESDRDSVRLEIERLSHGHDLPLPAYATSGSAGLDLCAAVEGELWLAPGARRAVPTGLKLAIPLGFEAQVRPRSGLALRAGLGIPNAPGTIDSDYRGELQVALVNLSDRPVRIRRGERIAQLVIAPVARAQVVEVSQLTSTARGEGGFGSTGR
jgi:dUTP diphosphatase